MTPDLWFGLFTAIVGFVFGGILFAPRCPDGPHVLLPPPSRPAPPMPGVQTARRGRPWPTQSLLERHVNAAIEALKRSTNTDAAMEDALRSAEYFIGQARLELANRKETGHG